VSPIKNVCNHNKNKHEKNDSISLVGRVPNSQIKIGLGQANSVDSVTKPADEISSEQVPVFRRKDKKRQKDINSWLLWRGIAAPKAKKRYAIKQAKANKLEKMAERQKSSPSENPRKTSDGERSVVPDLPSAVSDSGSGPPSLEKRICEDLKWYERQYQDSKNVIPEVKTVEIKPVSTVPENILDQSLGNFLNERKLTIFMVITGLVLFAMYHLYYNYPYLLIGLFVILALVMLVKGDQSIMFVKDYLLNTFSDSTPTVLKTATETQEQRIDFSQNDEFREKGIILSQPATRPGAAQFNYKVKVRINDDDFVIAEIDTDSHICLITEEYFLELAKNAEIEFINEPPLEFNGLASRVKSKYSPVMLSVQIGRVIMKNRFVVTDSLKSSHILLGSDFLMDNKVAVAPHENDKWYVTIGPLNDPTSKVPAFITNKIILSSKKGTFFTPFEIKRISVSGGATDTEKDLFKKFGSHSRVEIKSDLPNFSPFRVVDEVGGKNGSVLVENMMPARVYLPAGLDLALSDLDLSVFKVQQPLPKIKEFEIVNNNTEGETVLSTDELERLLEPGIELKNTIDKESELQFIKNHEKIPERFKEPFIKFLDSRAELFSGEEFSSKHFPREKYEHDVELLDKSTTHLTSRPFPCSGIRLQQLKADIDDLVKNGVLSPGDSAFTSPKKPEKEKPRLRAVYPFAPRGYFVPHTTALG